MIPVTFGHNRTGLQSRPCAMDSGVGRLITAATLASAVFNPSHASSLTSQPAPVLAPVGTPTAIVASPAATDRFTPQQPAMQALPSVATTVLSDRTEDLPPTGLTLFQQYTALPEVAQWRTEGGDFGVLRSKPDVVALMDSEGRAVNFQQLSASEDSVAATDVTQQIRQEIAENGDPFYNYFIEGGHTWTSPGQQFMENNEFMRRHLSEGGGAAFMKNDHNVVVALDALGNPQYYISVSPDGQDFSLATEYYGNDAGPTESNHDGKPLNFIVRGYGPGAATSQNFWDNDQMDPQLRLPEALQSLNLDTGTISLLRNEAIAQQQPMTTLLNNSAEFTLFRNGQAPSQIKFTLPLDASLIVQPGEDGDFGPRNLSYAAASKFHEGNDFGVASGTPLYALQRGTVSEAGWYGGYGNYTTIDYGNGMSSSYAHQSAFADGIAPGASVEQGQIIGYSGSTGNSTGPHLHFEIRRDGNPVDPWPYIEHALNITA